MPLRFLLACILLLSTPSPSCVGWDSAPQAARSDASQGAQDDRATIAGSVVAVLDGDTITVLDGQRREHRIRLAGIDAPESRQDFGQAAKRHLSGLVFEKQVEVRYSKRDRYGRVLGVVYRGGEDINLAQVAAGFAWHYKEYAHEQLPGERESYAEAEQFARREGKGLWRGSNPVKPSEFRRGGQR